MEVFEADTILQSLKPWIFITTIYGLRPYGLTSNSDRITVRFSYVLLLYSVAIISAEFIILFWVIQYVFTYNVTSVNSYVMNLDYSVAMFLWSVANFINLWKYKTFIDILNRIAIIDRGFQGIGIKISYKRDKKQLILSLLCALLISSNYYFHDSYFYSDEVKFPSIAYFLDMTITISRHWFLIQIVQLVNFLKFRYKKINSKLRNFPYGKSDKPHINKIFLVGSNEINEIHTLRKLYDDLFRVVKIINKTFGVRLTIFMGTALEILVVNAYYAITSLIKGIKEGNIVVLDVYDAGTIAIEFAISMLYLVIAFGGTVEAAEKTGALVERLLFKVKDEDTVKEVRRWWGKT